MEERDRVAADMRLISGAVEGDLSTLTGESAPVLRSATLIDPAVPRSAAQDLLFSGTSATVISTRNSPIASCETCCTPATTAACS